MKRFSFILLIISMFMMQAMAQPGRDQGRFKEGRHPGMGKQFAGQEKGFRIIERLGLNEEQAKKFNVIKINKEKELLPLRSEIAKVRDELALLKIEDNPNMKAIYSKIDNLTGLMAKQMKIRTRFNLEIRQMLTEEQRLLWDQHILKGKHCKHCQF